MAGLFGPPEYFQVKPHGLSQFQTFVAYMGGSAIQTVGDNPVTAYRQLVQQYAKDLNGKPVDPKVAVSGPASCTHCRWLCLCSVPTLFLLCCALPALVCCCY